MIKVAFCDDDVAVLGEVSALLDQYRVERNQEIGYAAFKSPLELLAEIEHGMQFDILFLDVIMPGQNGISAAKEIRKFDSSVKIIFLTSSSEFAVQSYTVNAFFYQLKPINRESFFRLMDSVVSECEKVQQNSLVLRCKSGITQIDLDRLVYCEVNGRTLIFHMDGGKVYESNGSMDELSAQLEVYECFLRPHRSYLINMEYIQQITTREIILTDRTEIPIPHGKCSEIKNQYLEYAFSRKQVVLS